MAKFQFFSKIKSLIYRNEFTSGIFYFSIAKYSGVVFQFFTVLILARLLTPKDFGIFTIMMVFLDFFQLIVIMGIGPAIVQYRNLSEYDIKNLYAVTYYLGIIVCLLIFAASPIIGRFYQSESIKTMLQLSTLHVFFSMINTVPGALASKNKDFKFISIRTFVIQVLTGIFSIVAALLNCGIYSLVISLIFSSIMLFAVTIKKYPVPFSWKFNFSSVKIICRFSVFQILFNVCNMLYRRMDKLLLGKFVDLSTFGCYGKSLNLVQMPVDNIVHVITPVLHPVLAEHQKDEGYIYAAYIKLVRVVSSFSFLLSIFIFSSSREIILVLYGKKWVDAIPFFRTFSLLVGILVVQSLVGAIFQSKDRTDSLFKCAVLSLITSIVFYTVGIKFYSIHAFANIVVVSSYVIFFIYHVILFKEVFHKNILLFINALLPAIIFAIGIGVIYCLLDYFFFVDNVYVSLFNKLFLFLLCCYLVYRISKHYNLVKKI